MTKSKTGFRKTRRTENTAGGLGCRCGQSKLGKSSHVKRPPSMAWSGIVGLTSGTPEAARRYGYVLSEGILNDGIVGMVMAELGEI